MYTNCIFNLTIVTVFVMANTPLKKKTEYRVMAASPISIVHGLPTLTSRHLCIRWLHGNILISLSIKLRFFQGEIKITVFQKIHS